MRKRSRVLLLLLPLALPACVAFPGGPPPVPPVREERIPVAPPSRQTQIWRPGHWDWDGKHFVWLAGEWVPRAGHGPLWQDGFWRRHPAGYIWVPAHWI